MHVISPRPVQHGGMKKTPFSGRCKVIMFEKLPYGTETLYTKFELDLWGVRIRAKSLKFWECYNGQNYICYFPKIWGMKYAPRWVDFKCGIKIEIKQLLTPFLANKTVENDQILAKQPNLPDFGRFLDKTGSNVVRLQFWGQIWNPLILAHISDPQKWGK